ncbi:MAG TPA: respiratory nitrate reductase subunit gamma [Gaiellales bacterium]|nr:respiratory nitrate reductase subunit gamma [Gaiellales bacterium]
MSAVHLLLWVALPYAAIAIFIGGHIWRYRTDQYGWTTRSTQLLESRQLKWGSILFHVGALAAIGGHVLGILVPATWTSAVGVSEHAYHLLSAAAGTAAGVVCGGGLVLLAWRRSSNRRVRATTTRMDAATYVLLALVIVLGLAETIVRNTLGGGYDYRSSVAVWFRSIIFLHPEPSEMVGIPLVYQVHATVAWLLFLIWPFSRLVHAWSVPLQYLGRPYILYRRRWALVKRT